MNLGYMIEMKKVVIVAPNKIAGDKSYKN